MELNQEASKKIEELQILESRLQSLLAQKQTFQLELNEINNAINELENMPKGEEEIYRVSYDIMLKSTKEKVIKDLIEKKKVSDVRISSIERQQTLIEKNIEESRSEINNILTKKKGK